MDLRHIPYSWNTQDPYVIDAQIRTSYSFASRCFAAFKFKSCHCLLRIGECQKFNIPIKLWINLQKLCVVFLYVMTALCPYVDIYLQYVVALFFFADIKLWNTGWIWYVGFAVALVGGYSARAAQLKIRPFSSAPYPRGWLKSRRKKRSADED